MRWLLKLAKNGSYHDCPFFIHRRCRTGRRYEGASGRRRISWLLLQRQQVMTITGSRRSRTEIRQLRQVAAFSLYPEKMLTEERKILWGSCSRTVKAFHIETIEGKDLPDQLQTVSEETLFNIIQMDVPAALDLVCRKRSHRTGKHNGVVLRKLSSCE